MVAGLLALVLPAWGGSAPLPVAPAPTASPRMPSTPTAQAIQRITLEIETHGQPGGLRLEFRRDGSVEATVTGQARHGTADRVSRARLPPAEFQALAQRLLDEGYFTMAERHEPEGLVDGTWAQLTVLHTGGQHQVFRREDAAPPGLQRLEAALLGLQQRLQFTPVAN